MPRKSSVDWSRVDWSLTNDAIARQVGVSSSTVWERRNRLGIPQHRRGGRDRAPKKQYTCRWCGRTFTRADRRDPHRGYCCAEHGALALAAARRVQWQDRSFPQEMAARSPLCRPDENNQAASAWQVVAPDGARYEFRNLAHFVRTHPQLFDAADLIARAGRSCNAAFGLAALRPRAGGKQPKISWKGWTWAGSDRIPLRQRTNYRKWTEPMKQANPLEWQQHLDRLAQQQRQRTQREQARRDQNVLRELLSQEAPPAP